jgi:hypothetical protein
VDVGERDIDTFLESECQRPRRSRAIGKV